MKANKFITIALAAVCGAAILSGGSAFAAEEGATYYPVLTTVDEKEVQPFEHNLAFSADRPINDYAISGNNYAFASGTSLFVLYTDTNGERCLAGDGDNPINARSRIEKIEYAEDKLYVGVEDGNTYLYPDLSNAVDYTISSNDNKHVILSSQEEYRLLNNELCYIYGDSLDNLGEGYSVIKTYGDKAYAVKENVLYTFDKDKETAADLSYTNFEDADRILAGDAVNALKDKNYKVKWATIKADCYYTQIDARKFIDGKFVQLSAAEGGKRTRKSGGGINCLILAESGNATVVANDDGCFITATENLEKHDYSAPLNDWELNADEKRLAYAITACGVYSSPYMCELTKITTLAQGSSTPVEVIEKFTLPFIKTTFYKVKYGEGENEVTGFVASDFLSKYDFAAEDNPPHEGGDEEFDYNTNVVSVVLAIVIVGLVMIAGMYLFLICTNKGKPKKQKKEKKKKPEPVSDPEPYDEEE